MILAKTIQTELNAMAQRLIKVLGWGQYDVQTAYLVQPSGMDAPPIKDVVALWAATGNRAEPIIIGFINKNQLAKDGDVRFFSQDANGVQQNYIWIKNDKDIEIGGDADNMVRFSKLQQAFDQLKSDFNAHVAAYNSHVHPILNAVPLATPPGVVTSTPTPSTSAPSTANIQPAKINEIKTS